MHNKLSSKYPGAEGFLWWIKKANELNFLRTPPCRERIKWSQRRTIKGRLKARIRHFIFCHNHPWRVLPHEPGCEVPLSALPQYSTESLEKQFQKEFIS
jgi:hypothetical protein